jgi:nitric oxide reductase NorD protein
MISPTPSPLDDLGIADPQTYVWVKGRVIMLSPPPSGDALALLSQETIWGLSQEPGLGRAVAEGILYLMGRGCVQRLQTYVDLVHRAAATGATLGRMVATFAAPVVQGDSRLLEQFQRTLAIMLGKGTYTLSAPLEALTELIAAGDDAAAAAYLDLLAVTFDRQISYNLSLRLVYLLPKAVRTFAPARRRSQIDRLKEVARKDIRLVEPFLDGMEKGLGLLDARALEQFTAAALEKYARSPEAGLKFLSLASKVGQEACAALQRAVPLGQVKSRLVRYMQARLGRPVAVMVLSELPAMPAHGPWVASDGHTIYLPDEIDRYARREGNFQLYQTLARLEAGYFEFGTFDFDLERAGDRYAEVARRMQPGGSGDPRETGCDAERFLKGFFPQALARDLFDLYEQARVAGNLNRRYPGLMNQVTSALKEEAHDAGFMDGGHLLAPVYARLVFDPAAPLAAAPQSGWQRHLVELFDPYGDAASPVEASARLVCLAFDYLRVVLGRKLNRYRPISLPFERRIHWDLVGQAAAALEPTVRRIRMRLKDHGLRVYRSELRRRLEERRGRLSTDDLTELVLGHADGRDRTRMAAQISGLDLAAVLQKSGLPDYAGVPDRDAATRYPEWDNHLQDYLHDYAYVRDIEVSAEGGAQFYHRTLVRYGGLVSRMRRAFEMLKPEKVAILRQWPEGDAFDYRALIDFAIDRRAGRIPSDRLFIKRLKQERDVAVQLLVDLSRSTANPVTGGDASVLDVAKEALVLFCEALQVVGDDYAIAGFSGTGRYAVDFYGIKAFQEPLNDAVRARISGLMPQRSTRMGAAIRHAAAALSRVQARVRLMIMISDGFPNDLGYKADYAIADTRRAVQETRARNFHFKAITVNIGSDPRLDDLYGRVHHHVIGQVRELPDKLLRLYGALTRF